MRDRARAMMVLFVATTASACWRDVPIIGQPDGGTAEADAGRSRTPSIVWTRQATGASSARAVAVDEVGAVYVAGSFANPASLGALVLTAEHGHENLLAKLDRDGRPLWARLLGGCELAELPMALVVDGDGNAIVAAPFAGSVTLGETVLHASGTADILLAKLGPSGRVLWATSIERGAPLNETGLGLAVDGEGAVTVAGAFSTRARLGELTLGEHGNEDIFVARLDREGAFRWATSAGGILLDGGAAVSVDATGRSTLLGLWTGKARFGRHALALPQEMPSTRCFLARLDPQGEFEQVASLDSLGLGRCTALAVGPDGAATIGGGNYLASDAYSGSFVLRLAPGGGGWLALDALTAKPIVGEGRVATGLVVDSRGAVSVVGHLLGGARFGTTTLVAQGESDAFVAGLDPGGRYLWALALGGERTDLGQAIAADREGNLIIAGTSAADLLQPGRLTVWKLGR